MSALETSDSKAGEPVDEGLAGYRSVSPWSILSLILGIASPLAMIGPVLWVVPGLGIVVGLVALRSLAADADHLIGRKAAVAGLALSLLFFTAAISAAATNRWWLATEARTVAEQWFELLSEDHPKAAYQMTPQRSAPTTAFPGGWPGGANDEEPKDPLQRFVEQPLIRFLLAHGKQAQIRHWSTEAVGAADKKSDSASLVYAVTWQHEDRKESFFVRLILRRELGKTIEDGAWTVAHFEGGVNPFEEEI